MQRSTLSRGAVIGTMLVVAMLAWVVKPSGQAVRPVPGPGTGIVTVEGTVNVGNTPTVAVGNTPTVNAAQSGNWKVMLANAPSVTVTNPDFLRVNRVYIVTWPDRATESVEVAELGANGWIRVERQGRRRWVNLGQALFLEESGDPSR
ncbi:MAG: hypothetical protein WBC51_28020 [Vicinamibacterales bacterium]